MMDMRFSLIRLLVVLQGLMMMIVVVIVVVIVLLLMGMRMRMMLLVLMMIMLRLLGFWVRFMGFMVSMNHWLGRIENGRYESRKLFFSANILRNSTQDWYLGRNGILAGCMVTMMRLFIIRLHRLRYLAEHIVILRIREVMRFWPMFVVGLFRLFRLVGNMGCLGIA
jgi:hypothetical protein